MNVEMIEKAYNELIASRKVYHTAAEETINAKFRLEKKKAELLLSGEIAGKNADEREANTRQIMANDFAELHTKEAFERETRLLYEVRQLEVEKLRMELRLLELEAKAQISTE